MKELPTKIEKGNAKIEIIGLRYKDVRNLRDIRTGR